MNLENFLFTLAIILDDFDEPEVEEEETEDDEDEE